MSGKAASDPRKSRRTCLAGQADSAHLQFNFTYLSPKTSSIRPTIKLPLECFAVIHVDRRPGYDRKAYLSTRRRSLSGCLRLTRHFPRSRRNLDVQDYFGHTTLIHSCSAGNVDIALQLLEAGASPDVVNYKGETALHAAARDGHAECVRALCSHGAAVDVSNIEGKTPLHLAERAGHLDAAAQVLVASHVLANASTTTTIQ